MNPRQGKIQIKNSSLPSYLFFFFSVTRTEFFLSINIGSLNKLWSYIHALESLGQDCDITSHIIYIACVNFIHGWRNIQFKADFKQISETFIIALVYILSELLPEICWEDRRRNIFRNFILKLDLVYERPYV